MYVALWVLVLTSVFGLPKDFSFHLVLEQENALRSVNLHKHQIIHSVHIFNIDVSINNYY